MSNAQCQICRDPATRDLVAHAIRGGDRPSEVWNRYGAEGLGTSQSSLYRHVHHMPRTALTTSFIAGDSTVGEVASDLDTLRRSLVGDYMEARQRGADSAARGSAREISNVSGVLLRAGLNDGDMIESLNHAEQLIRSVQRAARNDASHAVAIADAARELGYRDLATEADKLAAKAVEFHRSTNRTKENHD